MERNNDLALLRPFDLAAAKRGEKICFSHDGTALEFIAERTNCVVVHDSYGFQITATPSQAYKMAPLAWVEGKPVYKGDVLYQFYDQHNKNRLVTISDTFTNGTANYLTFTEGGDWDMSGNISKLTWNKPKIKKSGWMNCYEHNENSVYPTKTRADLYALSSRTACIKIFWEE